MNLEQLIANATRFMRLLPSERHDRGMTQVRALQRLAARAEPALRRAFLAAVAATVNGTVRANIRAAVEAGDIEAALRAVPWDQAASPVLRAQLMGAFIDTFVAAGQVQVDALPKKDRFPFGIVDDRPLEWIRQHGARLVDDFGLESREGLRQVLGAMMRDGLTPSMTAKLLEHHVGLSRPYAKAVENLRERLMAADDPKLEQKVARYARQLLQSRTRSIARTEAQFAVQNGQHQAQLAAAERGAIDAAVAKRRWITAGDEVVRDEHADMEDQVVGLEEPFVMTNRKGQTEYHMTPPAGPNCRCGVELLAEGE